MEKPSIDFSSRETYTDSNIYSLPISPLKWAHLPSSVNRYKFYEVKGLTYWPSETSPSQLEQAMASMPLQYMISGALKAMRTLPNPRVLVMDLQTPYSLPGVQLYVSPGGNWHYDLGGTTENVTIEKLEQANELRYVYFQNDLYFVAMRCSADKKDILLFVYKKC